MTEHEYRFCHVGNADNDASEKNLWNEHQGHPKHSLSRIFDKRRNGQPDADANQRSRRDGEEAQSECDA